jgi:nuclear GTP-binding protein
MEEESEEDQDELDEDEDEEAMDEMDEDVLKPAATPEVALNMSKLKAPTKQKKGAPTPSILQTAEKIINPQTNKDMKKMLKQKKKQGRRAQQMEDEEAYDFSEHFGLPSAEMDED